MSAIPQARPERCHVLVMAKEPVPGRVKTRLCPPCSPEEAATVAEAALADTMAAVAACSAEVKVVALDGRPGPWLPAGVDVIAQRGDGLAERLTNAWADVGRTSGGWGIQVGMDTPQVTGADLDLLLGLLARPTADRHGGGHAVLAPASDGGWWAIGLPGIDPAPVFDGVPMSTSWTGRAQAERLRHLGLGVRYGPPRRDIDRWEDLVAVARLAPWTRTAGALRTMVRRRGPVAAEVGR